MQESTAQDKIQALIAQYKNGAKKPSESDNIVIKMLEPLVTKKYVDDPKKHLEAIIVDLSAILKIRYTQTVTKKTFTKKSITTFTPDVLGGNVTPGIHGDIETLVADLRQNLSEITQRTAAPVKNNDTELAEAKRQIQEANRRLEALTAEKARAEAAAAEAKRQAETVAAQEKAKAEALLAAEKARTDAAFAAEKKRGKEERERLRAERRAAKEEAKAEKAKAEAKALEAQQAQAQLQTKDAEVKAAKDTAAKTQTELQEYKSGEGQRLQQATIDGATQVIRRVAEVVGTNEIMLLAINQGFGGMQEFTSALITGNTKHANGNGQLANSNHSQPPAVATTAAVGMLEAEEKKYIGNLGKTRLAIILRLQSLHEAAKTKNDRLMIQYLITQLAFHMDKSIQSIASETSKLLHNKKHFLEKNYPDFNAVLKSLSEDPQYQSEERGALTQEFCQFMVKRLGGKAGNGVFLLPTDEAGVKLFTQCYKILASDNKIIPPSAINTYGDTILGSMELPKVSSPIHTRKENAVNAGAHTLSQLRLNQ